MYLGKPQQIPVDLGTTGIVAPTVKYWKPGLTAMVSHVVQVADWVELGSGFYALSLPATLFDVPGKFLLEVDSVVIVDDVIPPPPSMLGYPFTCLVSGNLVTIGGQPGQNDQIVFRIVNVPKRFGQSMAVVDRIVTKPDAYGNFSVALLKGATVLAEIPQAGINQQFVVPDAPAADLADILHIV
jgi:hypothetical protein